MNPITRQDFQLVDFVFAKVGAILTTPTRTFRLVDYNRRVWNSQPAAGPAQGEVQRALPRRQEPLQMIVDQYVRATPAGVPVRLNITGFRQIEPCGVHVEVTGKIGNQSIMARALWTPRRSECDEIEVVVVRQHAFYLSLSLNQFTLAVVEVMGEEVPSLPCP